MGIYDRDYYRDDRRNPIDAVLGEGSVCKFLILATVAFFILPICLPRHMAPEFYAGLDLEPAKVVHGQIWRLVTYLFLHPDFLIFDNSIWSLAWTLLFLWWFGSDLEQLYGSIEFLIFYVLAGVLCGLSYTAWAYVRGSAELPVVGPAGAISAMLVLFALHFPSYKMRLWLIPVPIWIVVLVQIAGCVALAPQHDFGAFAMNLTGAIFGAIYYKKQWRLSALWPKLNANAPARVKVRSRPAEEEPVAVGATAAPVDVDEHLEAKVDAVLEKMGRSGKESLTTAERDILLRASELYRKKRT